VSSEEKPNHHRFFQPPADFTGIASVVALPRDYYTSLCHSEEAKKRKDEGRESKAVGKKIRLLCFVSGVEKGGGGGIL
jgi:hypothetical protein